MQTTRQESIERSVVADIVQQATLAPSGHNTQPWLFRMRPAAIEIRPDFSRRLAVVDADDHALYISVGAALENAVVAAHARGLDTQVDYFPANDDGVVLHLAPGRGRPTDTALAQAIPERQSTRSAYDGRAIPSRDLTRLEEASAREGIRLSLVTERTSMAPIVELACDAARRQASDRAFVDELVAWTRFARREVDLRRDGLIGPALGIPYVPRWLGSTVMRAALRPGAQARSVARSLAGSSALAVFLTERDDRLHWVKLGQSFERFALTATCLGLRHAHANMPCEVVAVRQELARHLRTPNGSPLLLLRLGHGKPMPRSPRRAVADVLLG